MNVFDRFDVWDAVLFALGVLGVVTFLWLLPGQHPDSAASFSLGREKAIERSRLFLSEQGYSTNDLKPVARLSRVSRLLDSLQTDLGRPEAVRVLKSGGTEELPAYYWNVRWQWTAVSEGFGPDANSRSVFEVDLSQGGVVWQFNNADAVVPRAGVDREVLRSLLQTPAETESEMDAMLMVPPDSALGAQFYFDFSSDSAVEDSVALIEADRARLAEAAATGRSQGLSEAAAAAIAREHVASTMLGQFPLVVQSVEALPERGRAAARVRFEAPERIHGQRVAIDADVTAAGALLGIDGIFNERKSESGHDPGVVEIRDSVDELVRWSVYAVILVVLLVVMFRRLSSRSLDANAALKDAILAAILVMVTIGLSIPMFAAEMGYSVSLALFLASGMVFGGAGFGLLIFVASSASDALARSAWPEQIATLSLARQSAWINQPVGRALVRGSAVGGLVVGLVTVMLVAFPQAVVTEENAIMAPELTVSVVTSVVAGSVWYGLLLVLAVFVGIGSIVRQWRMGAVVPALAVLLGAIGVKVLDLPSNILWLAWGLPFVLGIVLGVAYRRYDALTVLVAVVVSALLWDTAEGWLATASPARPDALLAYVIVAAVIGVGVAGVRSRRTSTVLPTYEPDYVAEQRERGRLQRELEIAREVQRSFLPARMPEAPGLDIAARCLAAEEVGGDYYDAVALGPGRLAIMIGDVSGKGIQAAFFMTLAKGFLQTLARETDSPAEVLRRANRLFAANAPRGTFVSLIYGILDLGAMTFTFARAGHNPVILKRSPNQTADFVQPAGLALGLTAHHVFDDTIEEHTIPLRPGDTIVLYTDGFSEAMNRSKTLYTDERLAERVARLRSETTAAELLDDLVADVQLHAGDAPQHDDMTMVVVRIASPVEATGTPASAPLSHPS